MTTVQSTRKYSRLLLLLAGMFALATLSVSQVYAQEGPPPGGVPRGAPGGAASVDTGTGAYILADGEALSGVTYTSTNDDENAIRAEGDVTATLNDVTVEKTGGSVSSNDASSFYGLNAAILALDDATLTINGGSVTATTEGSNGVFAYDGATIYINDTEITVSGGNAGGIEVAGGGSLYATNLTVNAAVKAAIRSGRWGHLHHQRKLRRSGHLQHGGYHGQQRHIGVQ